ncbi:MAG: hypothetical protein HKM04_04265 [Legionellales bacterium]|nr:hypothetical protein [Legionellales bacterium]
MSISKEEKALLAQATPENLVNLNQPSNFADSTFKLRISNIGGANVGSILDRGDVRPRSNFSIQGGDATFTLTNEVLAQNLHYFPLVQDQFVEHYKNKLTDISNLSPLHGSQFRLSFATESEKAMFIATMKRLGLNFSKNAGDNQSIVLTDKQLKKIDRALSIAPRDMEQLHGELNQRELGHFDRAVEKSNNLNDEETGQPLIVLRLNLNQADQAPFIQYLKDVIELKNANLVPPDHVSFNAADYRKLVTRYPALEQNNPNNTLITSATESLTEKVNFGQNSLADCNVNFYKKENVDYIGIQLDSPAEAQYFHDVFGVQSNADGKTLYLTEGEFNKISPIPPYHLYDEEPYNQFQADRTEFLGARRNGLQALRYGIDNQNLWSHGSHFVLVFENEPARDSFVAAAKLAGVELNGELKGDLPIVNISNHNFEILARHSFPRDHFYQAAKEAHAACRNNGLSLAVLENFDGNIDVAFEARSIKVELGNLTRDHIVSAIRQLNIDPFPLKGGPNIEFDLEHFAKVSDHFPKIKKKVKDEFIRALDLERLNLQEHDKNHFLLTFDSLEKRTAFMLGMEICGYKIDPNAANDPMHPQGLILSDKDMANVVKVMDDKADKKAVKTLHNALLVNSLTAGLESTLSDESLLVEPNRVEVRIKPGANTDELDYYLLKTLGLQSAGYIIRDEDEPEKPFHLSYPDFIKLATLDTDPHFKSDNATDNKLQVFCKGLRDSALEPTKALLQSKVLEEGGELDDLFNPASLTDVCQFYRHKGSGDILLGISCESVDEANYFRTILNIQDGANGNILYLDETNFKKLLGRDLAPIRKQFVETRNAGLIPLKIGLTDLTLRNGKSGDFILTIKNPIALSKFIDAAKVCGVILTADINNRIHINDEQYTLLAAAIFPSTDPLRQPDNAHAQIAEISLARYSKENAHKLLCDSFTGKVSESLQRLNGQPLILLDLNDDVDENALLRDLYDIFRLKSAKLVMDHEKGKGILLSASDWHKLTTLDKEPGFSSGEPELDKRTTDLLAKMRSPDSALMTDALYDFSDLVYKLDENDELMFMPSYKMYQRDGTNKIGVECDSVEMADYYRQVLGIEDTEKGNIVYLDEAKFNALYNNEDWGTVSFNQVQSAYFDPRHSDLVPIKAAMQTGELKNKPAGGFSLEIKGTLAPAALIAAAKQCGVTLKIDANNKMLISDSEYAKLAAPFAKEKLSYLPAEAAQAHANCAVNDLCRCIDLRNTSIKRSQNGNIRLKLNDDAGINKKDIPQFLKHRFGLSSATLSELGNVVELSQKDFKALLALPENKRYAKNETLKTHLKPLQDKYKASTNVLKAGKNTPPASSSKDKKKESETSFGKANEKKVVDEKAVSERMSRLDNWIAKSPQTREKVATTGNPLAPTVKVKNETDDSKSGEFVYNTEKNQVKAYGDNRKPEIYDAMLDVLEMDGDPMVEVNVTFNTKNATPEEREANLTVAAEAFAAALKAGYLPVIDERCPFTQTQIAAKLNKDDKQAYRTLRQAVDNKKPPVPAEEMAKLKAAENRKAVVVNDEKVETPKKPVQAEGDEPDASTGNKLTK